MLHQNDAPGILSNIPVRMKKRVSTKRLLVIVLAGIVVGASAIIGVYLHGLADTNEGLVGRRHQLRFCGRCGYQEWFTTTRVAGFESFHHAPMDGQKKDFAGIDQSTCEHAFFSIGINEAMFVLPDFKMSRSSFGTLSNDLFFQKPILVESYRTLEKENNPNDARNVFFHLIMGAKFRSGPFGNGLSTNLATALNGTNSQVLVEALYKSYEDGGQKLQRDKHK
jgi:hypothetical protein